jgi:hypothetical protein
MSNKQREEEMNSAEQLDAIESILERAGKQQPATPLTYLAWGIAGGLYNLAYFGAFYHDQVLITKIAVIVTVIAYAMTILEYARLRRLRSTAFQRQAVMIFGGITTIMWLLKILWLSSSLISGAAFALMWSLGFTIALLVLGIGPMRPLAVGGLALLACIILASAFPENLALLLAIGNLLGLCGPGVYFLVRKG